MGCIIARLRTIVLIILSMNATINTFSVNVFVLFSDLMLSVHLILHAGRCSGKRSVRVGTIGKVESVMYCMHRCLDNLSVTVVNIIIMPWCHETKATYEDPYA